MVLIEILMDTNAYVEFKRANPQTLEILRYAQTIAINNVVLAELLAGFSVGHQEAENQRELNQFLERPRVKLLSSDEVTAKYYAMIYKALRNKGKPIPTNDMWIAATAMQYHLTLLTYDKHFANIEGLSQCRRLSDFFPQ
ncbi:MAG TPA: type II toxin-antitoxin system VapC family toxin [Thiotrichaceae bacterium]|nr:type II toxin-antitoxin system VapC family toxin [Thiotrichaceae bacterium]